MDQNTVWPGWKTIRPIGRGSFGTVYEIQRDVLGETEKAALKVISIPLDNDDITEMYNDGYDATSITCTFDSYLKNIVAEYTLMRKMNGHTNVVNCDDVQYIQHDNGIGWDIYIKMELLTPLTKALPKDISDSMVIKMASDMCEALKLCRTHDIIHRDIKPQNIFVSESGDFKLGDFGIAKTAEKTTGGTKIGTYRYMAPEVYNNKPYGSSVDIYSLGLVMYWLLNERRMPFLPLPPEGITADMDESARQRRFAGEPLPAPKNGSNSLKEIVLKACAFDPRDRYQSAEEMLDALRNIASVKTRKPPKRKLFGILACTASFVVALALISSMFAPKNSAVEPAEPTKPSVPDSVSTNSAEPPTELHVTVMDAYFETLIEPFYGIPCCYHIPQVSSTLSSCSEFNSAMYKELCGYIQEDVYEDLQEYENFDLIQTSYNWGQKGNLVSILVRNHYSFHEWKNYYTYNVFADTGKAATSKDLLDAFQITEEEFEQILKQRIRECFSLDEDIQQLYANGALDSFIADSLDPSNLREAQLFIGTDGELYAHTGVYWPVGSGYFPRLVGITCQSEALFTPCESHPINAYSQEWAPDDTYDLNAQVFALAEIGDIVQFGTYEQDNNFTNGQEPIQWVVLDKTEDRLFVISRYALEHQSYHTTRTAVTWEKSYLRQWLNDSFYKTAFTAEEQQLIPTVTVTADWNPKYDNNPGKDTQDKIYILSTREAEWYFASNTDRIGYPTKYAKSSKNVWVDSDRGSIWWWLRTPGKNQTDATTVNTDGKIDYKNGMVDSTTGTVRPVLWIAFQ